MYLRRCYKVKDGKRHAYWALVESVRTARGPRQRVVAHLGDLEKQAARDSAAGLRPLGGQGVLFDEAHRQWLTVDAARLEVVDCKALGGPLLGMDLIGRLGLMEFFERVMPGGREEVPWSAMAAVPVLCRLLDPSSELYIAEHGYERSALSDLLGVPAAKVNDDRLYRSLDQLLPHKQDLQQHLKNRLGELFELDYDLILYDVTSTCFEGLCEGNALAQRGYSRDHRGDCKQVCIGLVVSRCGMAASDGSAWLNWSKDETWKDWATMSEGCYILRGNVTDWKDQDLWEAYIQLTEAEGAFRIHKTDLSLRPIWHQKGDRVQAHILVCFLAYVLWKTLGQLCRRAGLGNEPRKVLDESVADSGHRRDGADPPGRRLARPAPAQALRPPPQRPPGDPATSPGPPPARPNENHGPTTRQFQGDVVKTFKEPPLIAKHLRQQLRKLG